MLDKILVVFWVSFISIFSISILLLTSKSRYSKKKTILATIFFEIAITIANILLFINKPLTEFELLSPITILIPQLIFIIIIDKRGIVSSITASLNVYLAIYTIQLLQSLLNRYFFMDDRWVDFIYTILYPVVWLYIKLFYIDLHNDIETNFPKLINYIFAFTITIFSFIYIYTFIIQKGQTGLLRVEIFSFAVLACYYFSYLIFYMILKFYKRELIQEKKAELSKKEIAHIQDRIKLRETKEKEMKILRHDLRHVLIAISQMITDNKRNDALELINTYIRKVDSGNVKNYCNSYVIDSVIDYYVNVCKNNNIDFHIQICDFEDELDIPDYDFAVFISNCLENAVNATLKLETNRKISLVFLNNFGRLVLQIKNTYNGVIKLDKHKKPVNKAKDHGFGTKSIELFAQQNNLLLDYQITNELFVINVLLN